MKILKRPENVVFDTENPNHMEYLPTAKPQPTPLHQATGRGDLEFLSEYFQTEEHPIFRDFGNSYIYVLELEEA